MRVLSHELKTFLILLLLIKTRAHHVCIKSQSVAPSQIAPREKLNKAATQTGSLRGSLIKDKMFYLLHGLDDIHVIHVYVHKIKCSNFVVYKTPYFARSSVSTLTKSPARSFDVYIASINFFIIFLIFLLIYIRYLYLHTFLYINSRPYQLNIPFCCFVY